MAKLDKTPVKQSDEFTPEAAEIFTETPEVKDLLDEPFEAIPVPDPAPEPILEPEVMQAPKIVLDGVLCTLDKDFVKEYYDGKPFPLTSKSKLYIFEPPAYEVRLPEDEAKMYDASPTHPIQIKK